MKTLAKNEHQFPVHVSPGDTLCIEYIDPSGHTRRVAEASFDTVRQFDTFAVVEFDDDEVAALGMTDAVGGVMGRRERG